MTEVSISTDVFDGKILTRGIHRGIVAEIAREEGVSTSYVWQKINLWRNDITIAKAQRKMKERTAKHNAELQGVAA